MNAAWAWAVVGLSVAVMIAAYAAAGAAIKSMDAHMTGPGRPFYRAAARCRVFHAFVYVGLVVFVFAFPAAFVWTVTS